MVVEEGGGSENWLSEYTMEEGFLQRGVNNRVRCVDGCQGRWELSWVTVLWASRYWKNI